MSTKFDGQYHVNYLGNYEYRMTTPNKDKTQYIDFYANQNLVKFRDGFFFGQNETK